jgi:hypothetical protein
MAAKLTSVGEIILLQSHLSPRNNVSDYVLLRRVLINPVGPLVDGDHVAALLVDSPISRLVDERAAVQASYLATPYIGYFEVRVQQQIEGERMILARVVHANVEMQLLLP